MQAPCCSELLYLGPLHGSVTHMEEALMGRSRHENRHGTHEEEEELKRIVHEHVLTRRQVLGQGRTGVRPGRPAGAAVELVLQAAVLLQAGSQSAGGIDVAATVAALRECARRDKTR